MPFQETLHQRLLQKRPIQELNTDVNTYFAQARLERQKSRDASQELVQKVLDDTTADENTKTEAANQASEISQNIVTETNIENLVKIQRFCGLCSIYSKRSMQCGSAKRR